MSIQRSALTVLTTVAFAAAGNSSFGQPPPPPEAPAGKNPVVAAEANDGAEVYTRGPLHEAFAQPQFQEPRLGPVIPKRPPETIQEVPPNERPEGSAVEWIPGYWEWDDELNDFLWVSGLWRQVPPNRRWVPGYWAEVEGGFQRVSGMWVSEGVEQLTYLPPPPQSREEGPVGTAPADDYFWIPGNWEYTVTGYEWRPGYWSPFYQDWVWVPAHYVATPAGYIAVPGFWDYLLEDRGIVFAPVHFAAPVATFTPVTVINTWENFFVNLFVNPRYGTYSFGDYYGPTWKRAGVIPWFAFHGGRRGYDPLYSHYHHVYGENFVTRLRGWNDYYATQADHRPPATWRRFREHQHDHRDDALASLAPLAVSLTDIGNSKRRPFELTRLNDNDRRSFIDRSERWNSLRQDRGRFERDGRNIADRDRNPSDRRDDSPRRGFTLPRDSVTDANRARPGRNETAPGSTTPNDVPRPGREPDPGNVGRRPDPGDANDRTNPGREVDPRRNDRRPDAENADNRTRPGRRTDLTPPRIPSADSGRDDRDVRPTRPGTPGAAPGATPGRRDRSDPIPRFPGQRDDDRPGTGNRPPAAQPGGTPRNPNTPDTRRPATQTPGTTPRQPQPRPEDRREGPQARPIPEVRPQQPTPRQPTPKPEAQPQQPAPRPPATNPRPQPQRPGATSPTPGVRPQAPMPQRPAVPGTNPAAPRPQTPGAGTRRVPPPTTGGVPGAGRPSGGESFRPRAPSPGLNPGSVNPTPRPQRPATPTAPSAQPRNNPTAPPAFRGNPNPQRPANPGVRTAPAPRPQAPAQQPPGRGRNDERRGKG